MDARTDEGPGSLVHKGWHCRGYLPHRDQPHDLQVITFRLADAVPLERIDAWRDELGLCGKHSVDARRSAELRARIERFADRGFGACWLKIDVIAKIVEDALLHFDGERYALIAWCVMPNHVHLLIETKDGFPVSGIVQSWKSFTSKRCNQQLKREGPFWMADYFDRSIRNDKHLHAAIEYIETNPVVADLCAASDQWRWSSAWRRRHAGLGSQDPPWA